MPIGDARPVLCTDPDQRGLGVATEAAELGVSEMFVTGGEPFLLPDIGKILAACAAAVPTTVLTNGMLFAGRRLETLLSLPRDRLTLQISLDSPTPVRHDRHRGTGTWARAWRGIERARSEGFRVRLAATVATDAEAEEFRHFLDARQITEEDRVIRRIALRGFASLGIALARADLLPEITITADGVYWHPVGAEDFDLLVTSEIFPVGVRGALRPAMVATPGASEWVSCVSSPATNRSGRTPGKGAGNLANLPAAFQISLTIQ